MIHIEDYQREHLKDLVYLQEEKELFYRSLNHTEEAQIDVIDLREFKALQQNAKLNESIPASIIVKADKRLGNYERNTESLSFQRTS
jgi:bacillopeptidase F (M6 metalloprotease family)